MNESMRKVLTELGFKETKDGWICDIINGEGEEVRLLAFEAEDFFDRVILVTELYEDGSYDGSMTIHLSTFILQQED